jgi:segregation and condensation protein A
VVDIAQAQESSYNITLPVFEGPLDLLLHLIRENRIDIYDIPIAKVCEQYLVYLSLMESLDLELAGEWLVMAAALLEIKSRMLLPEGLKDESEPEEEQIDPRLELVERLIEYEKFKSAAEIFKEREEQRARVFVRGAAELSFDLKPTFDLENITAVDLLSVLQRILADVGGQEVTSIQKRTITVRMRMLEIRRRLAEAAGQLKFKDLFDGMIDRIEVVITFLALLELLKSHIVKVKQRAAFSPIEIHTTEPNGRQRHNT